jgi:hypothetical protein
MSMGTDWKEYSIGWQPQGPGTGLGQVLGLSEEVEIPFYVSGDYRADLEAGREVPGHAFDPVRGILLAYVEAGEEFAIEQSEFIRECMQKFAGEIAKTLPLSSAEKLVLDTAASLREENGPFVSRMALLSGMHAFPESSQMRSDYIFDTWITLTLVDPDEQLLALEGMANAFSEIDLARVNPEVIEALVFMEYVALSLLGRRQERETLDAAYVPEYIASDRLLHAMRYLRENTVYDREFVFSQEPWEEETEQA